MTFWHCRSRGRRVIRSPWVGTSKKTAERDGKREGRRAGIFPHRLEKARIPTVARRRGIGARGIKASGRGGPGAQGTPGSRWLGAAASKIHRNHTARFYRRAATFHRQTETRPRVLNTRSTQPGPVRRQLSCQPHISPPLSFSISVTPLRCESTSSSRAKCFVRFPPETSKYQLTFLRQNKTICKFNSLWSRENEIWLCKVRNQKDSCDMWPRVLAQLIRWRTPREMPDPKTGLLVWTIRTRVLCVISWTIKLTLWVLIIIRSWGESEEPPRDDGCTFIMTRHLLLRPTTIPITHSLPIYWPNVPLTLYLLNIPENLYEQVDILNFFPTVCMIGFELFFSPMIFNYVFSHFGMMVSAVFRIIIVYEYLGFIYFEHY